MRDLQERLERALNPRTVAVVGDKKAMGYMWLNCMSTFQGQVYSVQVDPYLGKVRPLEMKTPPPGSPKAEVNPK